ncbi:hypothetical protein [Streptomyces purpureus]|uniref:hypothetical protein n=1 Tax=Streptomyces purpureus TaxID=1951 RepID=UPI001319DBD1|nr:hypothetical protein [Streptomyces purpureus]
MDYLWSHGRRLHRSRHVNMKHIYGETWATESINLARYLVKQIGCRIEHDGFGVPAEFVDFLNGSTRVPSLHMVMYKDPDLWKMHKNLGDGDDWVLGEGFGPMTGEVSPSQGRLMMFSSSMVVGYIGVMYRWELGLTSADPFYVHQKARLYRRDKLPDS